MITKQAESNKYRNTERRGWACRLASMYEGLNLSSMHSLSYIGATQLTIGDQGDAYIWEEAASLMDTLQAKVAGLDDPKPQIMCTDGEWSDRRKAQWLDRFIYGQYTLPQGMFSDLWELWRHAFLLAITATGTSAVRFEANEDEGKVTATIRDTLDMWCDDFTGYPLTYGESSWKDAERECDLNPEHADLIWAAARKSDNDPNRMQGRSNEDFGLLVRIDEGWRCQLGENTGKYVKSVDGHPLDWDDYEYETPPHVFLTPKRRLTGMWGRPILQEVYQPIVMENEIAASIMRASRRVPQTIVYYDQAVVKKADLMVPEDVVLIPYDSQLGPPPIHNPPAFMHQNSLQMIELHNRKLHDIPGISEMQTGGKRDPGLTAAVAIRAVENLINERQSPAQRNYINAVAIESGKQIVRACKTLYDKDSKFLSTWKGQGFLKKIPAKDVLNLDDSLYVLDVGAVSGTKNTPADILQNAWELVQAQIITGDAYASIKQDLDLSGETKKLDTQRQYVNKQIENWLDATVADTQDPSFYEPAPKWLDQVDALSQVSEAYLQASMDGAPSHVRQYFLSYLTDLSNALDQKKAREAQLSNVTRGGAGNVPAAPQPPVQG